MAEDQSIYTTLSIDLIDAFRNETRYIQVNLRDNFVYDERRIKNEIKNPRVFKYRPVLTIRNTTAFRLYEDMMILPGMYDMSYQTTLHLSLVKI